MASISELKTHFKQPGKIEWIGLRPQRNQEIIEVESAEQFREIMLKLQLFRNLRWTNEIAIQKVMEIIVEGIKNNNYCIQHFVCISDCTRQVTADR